MAKDNSPPQKLSAHTTPRSGTEQPDAITPATKTAQDRKSSSTKRQKSKVGGTAVPGARSTQPRPIPTASNPQQQQAENYNRVMRRRMDNMGLGTSAESERAQALQQQRQKRIERKKKRLEERREELKKSLPAGSFKLGGRVLYPLIGVGVLIIILIVFFIIFRHPFG